jgi:hypothetical protein
VRSPVPAFRFTGVIPLLWPRLSHSTPDTQFRVGSSLQAGLYARTPVQSDYCAFKATVLLSPIPEDTTNCHWWQPLVTGLERSVLTRVLEVKAQIRLHWKDRFGYCAPLKPVTTVQKSANSCEPSKNRPPRRFFRLASKIRSPILSVKK